MAVGRSFLRLAAICLAAACLGATGPSRTAPTIEQSIGMVRIATPQLSPTGSAVAYELIRANWRDNRFDHEIWLDAAGDGRASRRVSAASASASDAAWSPDGSRLAFLSDDPFGAGRRGPPQVVIFDPATGRSLALTSAPSGVNAFRWAPDGRRLAYVADDAPEAAAARDAAQGGQLRLPEARVASRVWEISASAGTHRPHALSPEGKVTSDIAYAPDGRSIAVIAQAVTEPELTPNTGVYVLAAAGGWRRVAFAQGIARSPVWSPDGRRIAFLLTDRRRYLHSNARVVAVPAGGGALDVLDPGFDLDPNLDAWTSRGLLVDAFDRTASRLFRVDPAKRTVAALSPADWSITFPSFSPDGARVAYIGAAAGRPAEIMVATAPDWRGTDVTHMADQFAGFAHSTREVVTWRSNDGLIIEGVLEKPEGFVAGRRRPLLVILHGGPDWLDTPVVASDKDYPAERFLARGALVLRVNYRGSLGYGSAFRGAFAALGRAQYQDITSGVDHLVALGLVDAGRVGLMGWSFGGYVTAFAATFGHRFQAVSVGGGITDWRSFYLTSDLPHDPIEYFGAPPSDAADAYAAASPISYAGRAGTPTLIQHGADDPRVPLSQVRDLYRALADRGVTVRLRAFAGQGHQIERPKQQRALMEQNERWFGHFLWRDADPDELGV